MANDVIELDFSDVKDFAGSVKVPKGDYKLKVQSIELGTSKAKNPMWTVKSQFLTGPEAGATITERLALTEKALFKVKSFLEALGVTVGKRKLKLPNTTEGLQKLIGGKEYGVHIDDGDPYTNNQGETKVNSEVKYHLKPAEFASRAALGAANPVTVTQTEPTAPPVSSEAAVETVTAPAAEPDAPAGDTADQMESFDLDSL